MKQIRPKGIKDDAVNDGKIISREFCKRIKSDYADKWYKHNQNLSEKMRSIKLSGT